VLGGNLTRKLAGISSTLGRLILEHLHGSLCSIGGLGSSRGLLLIKALDDLPLTRGTLSNKIRSAVVTGNDNLVLIKEEAVHHRKELHLGDAGSGLTSLNDRNSAVVANEAKPVTRGAESDALDPTSAIKLAEGLIERLLLAPSSLNGTAIDLLDPAVEDTSLEISRSSGKKLIVGVPCDASDSAAVLLNVLADPPIVVLLEVADRHNLGAAGHSELITLRAPLHMSGSTVDTKDNQNRLPLLLDISPHVSVTILGASDDTVVDAIPVDASDNTVVLL